MTTSGAKRKLTAILSADVKGYSRLMEDDEEATVATLTGYKQVMTDVIEKHRGRVVDSPGDNLLAEFASVVDAMRGSVEIQEELRARNSELPDHRRMEFRIGINLGDVIEEDGRIYGDGVNIAARVEALADPGGICISGTAYDHLKNKLSLGIEFLGEHEVKNISEPVPVYRLVTESGAAPRKIKRRKAVQPGWRWATVALAAALAMVVGVVVIKTFVLEPSPPPVEPASIERMAFPLPEKPSIAVLPFVNMSGDPDQEYIADGISENITAALAKIPEMFVIARNSASSYKGNSPEVQQVAEELGVQHVLEGSIQRSEDRIRVTAQLIDATTGHHLWSEIYNRKMEDLFDLLDEITKEVVVALQVELTAGEQARARHETDNLEAWGYAVRADSLFERGISKEDYSKARQLYERAVTLDPGYVHAWTWLAWIHFYEARLGWSESPDESFERAEELAERALALDASHPDANALMGAIHSRRGEHEKALAWGEKSITLASNNAFVHAFLGTTLRYAGKPEEAIPLLKKAMRLHPYHPWWYSVQLGIVYRLTGRNEKSIATFKKNLARENVPELWQAYQHLYLAWCYVALGRMDEAQGEVERARTLKPDWSLESLAAFLAKANFYKDPAPDQAFLDALRKAGLPEKPPLPLPDRPSIAVLPFANISGDPEQEYFADGMTDDLITDLSKISGLFVIARNSVFSYKGLSPKVQDVGRELGVRYVLEGSVRKAGDQVRINAQLIDAKTGGHLWAERYDRDYQDIFALQDEVIRQIVSALSVTLSTGEEERITRKYTGSLEAYDYYLRGQQALQTFSHKGAKESKALFEKAIELDQRFAQAYAAHAEASFQLWAFEGNSDFLTQSAKFATKALVYDSNLPTAYLLIAYQQVLFDRAHENALVSTKKAIALDINYAYSYVVQAYVLTYSGRHDDARESMDIASRLDPQPNALRLAILGRVEFGRKNYVAAADALNKALELSPKNRYIRYPLVAIYAHLGELDLAKKELETVLKDQPWLSISGIKTYPYFSAYKLEADLEHYISGYRKAGLPELPYDFNGAEGDMLLEAELKSITIGRIYHCFSPVDENLNRIDRTRDYSIRNTEDGQMLLYGLGMNDQGLYRIEGNRLKYTWKTFGEPTFIVFRNPQGSRAEKNEYIFVGHQLIPCSVE